MVSHVFEDLQKRKAPQQYHLCHTRFWKANRMRTMYVTGAETHVHSDYIIGHHHTLLKINSEIGTLLYQDVQDIHRVIT
jgi:hypothetical protein